MILTAAFVVSSCTGDKLGKSQILILSEEKFDAAFEKLENSTVKITESAENLTEEEYIVEGKRYYAVLLLSNEKLSTGWLKFKGGVTVEETAWVSAETGEHFEIEREVSLEYRIKSKNEKEKKDFYVAFPFTVNAYESIEKPFIDDSGVVHGFSAEKLDVEFLTYKTVRGVKEERKVNKEKDIFHSKRVSSISSVKYLTGEDYRSGNIDEKLKDTLEIAVGEKCYAVIDYKLSSYANISELDRLLAQITASSDDGAVFNLELEALPTTEYTEQNNEISAIFKIHAGAENSKAFRFIVSVVAERAGSIKIGSSLFDSKISVLGDKSAAGSITVNGNLTLESKLEFQLSSDGRYYILVGLGTEYGDTVVVPATYKGKSVKEIAANVFANLSYLKEITLPEGLETIGSNAFGGENQAKYIVIPSTVTDIGVGAFNGWSGKYIYCEAKEKPSAWEENWAPSDVNVIWDHVESHYSLNADGKSYTLIIYVDSNRESINVPETYKGLPVTGIADTAFMVCDKVKRIHLSRYITEIAFLSHSNLDELTVDSENTVYKCSGGCLIDMRDGTLVSGGNNSVIPTDGSVTQIGDKAFYCCEELTEIYIPASVVSIGSEAFYSCTALNSVVFAENSILESIGASAFKYCLSITEIIIPDRVKEIEESTFENCYLLERITVGDKLEAIKYHAFYNCADLNEINYKGSEQAWAEIIKNDDCAKYHNNGRDEDINYTVIFISSGE